MRIRSIFKYICDFVFSAIFASIFVLTWGVVTGRGAQVLLDATLIAGFLFVLVAIVALYSLCKMRKVVNQLDIPELKHKGWFQILQLIALLISILLCFVFYPID